VKPELRKALEAELDHLTVRVGAIKLLLEGSESGSTAPAPSAERAPERKKADGRSLRWQKATPQERSKWLAAIRAGRRRQHAKGK